MCGRYSITTPGEVLAEAFGLDQVPELTPRYNAAPTQALPVVHLEDHRRRLALFRFGLTHGASPLLINARSETAADLPAFRGAFRKRRCVVPADGFFEWRSLPGVKKRQPYYIHGAQPGPLALAGLWEEADAGAPPSFAILTTAPNATVARIHDRMPAILAADAVAVWLAPDSPVDRLVGLLRPAPQELLLAHPVSLLVNDVRNDLPEVARRLF